MSVKCPKCSTVLEVRLTAAPPMQADSASSNLADLLDRIDDSQVSGAAEKFVRETRERFEQYGSRTRMSEKQLAWLNRIASGEDNEW